MARFYQISAEGVLHKMEAGHAGEGASNPMPAHLVTLAKYELCGHCFPKSRVGGALDPGPVPAKPRKRRTRRVAHGVRTEE